MSNVEAIITNGWRAIKIAAVLLLVSISVGCTYASLGMYEEPDQGPVSTLQLDIQALKSDHMAFYPNVSYYDGPTCTNKRHLNHNIDLFYREGNPPQDLSNNIWRDYVGYKIPAGKNVVLSVTGAKQVTVYIDYISSLKKQILNVYRCSVTLSYQSRPDEIYRLIYRETDNGCSAKIVNVETDSENIALQEETTMKIITPGCFDHKSETLETVYY